MKKYMLPFLPLIFLLGPLFITAATNPCWTIAISSSPSPAYPGDTVTFVATLQVKFEGVTNLRVIGVIDGVMFYDNNFASLGAGATRNVSMTWPATLGTHTVYFQLDPDDTIPEVGTDNLTTTTFTIGAMPPVTPLNIYFRDHSIAPAREVSGEESFINYQIHIADPWESTFDVTVAFKVNGVQVDTETFTFTGAGLSGGRVGRFTRNTECGATYELVIDPLNAVIETNEADNSWTHTVSCVEPFRPNLIISQYLVSWTPQYIHAGEAITINYTTNNIGEEASPGYKVGLKVGDSIVARKSHGAHPSGVTQTGSFTWTADCSGPLSLMIDCDSEVIESNETDNTYQNDSFKCSVPNLKTWDLNCSHGDSNEVPAGAPYQYSLQYSLSDDSSASNVRVRIGIVGGEVLLDEVIPTVERTISTRPRARVTKIFEPGSYNIYGIIDPENTIAELDETDNRVELFIRAVDEGATDRRFIPAGPAAKLNFKIVMDNKKALQRADIEHSSEVWVNGVLSCTGKESSLKSNVNVALHEENITNKTKRLIWEETIKLGPGETKKFKWRWSPNEAGKIKLILRINPPDGDTNPIDNKDEVLVNVK